MAINYFKEDINIDLRQFISLKKWLVKIADEYKMDIEDINYILCSDKYLHQINLTYLQHDTFTDIITFDNREHLTDAIEADIFISTERVEENAAKEHVTFKEELSRVMVHGLLHLFGLKDKTEKEKEHMRAAEDKALSTLKSN